MKIIYFLLIILIFRNYNGYWWLYSPEDHDKLFSEKASPEENQFMEDQGQCLIMSNESCYLANSNLNSTGNLENKCCLLKTSSHNESYCTTIFSGKYFESNLYSIDLYYGNDNFTYDCDGNGDKTFKSSLYNPTQSWEITNKEKYDCIYSETEEECQANPKKFIKNTKCCWFSNGEIYDMASCFGVKELTDDEFNRIIPYITRARLYNDNKTMDFHCYDKSDKITNGTFDLEFNYIMMKSVEQKMAIEMESEDVLNLFAKKQSFIGIKDYESDYMYNYFRMYTISPDGNLDKVFTISTRFKYKITSSRNRNLEDSNDGYIEKIVPCTPESVDNSSNLNITLSKCSLKNEEGKEIEQINIQKGNDLVGNFEEGKNEIYEGKQFMTDDDINKIKESATFTFKNPTANLKDNILEGETTEDRKNVKFVLYYSKDSNVETIQAEASFLKESQKVNFIMNPSINLKNGKTIIPNQMCKGENGEYLYIVNKIGTIEQNNEDNKEGKRRRFIGKKNKLSTGALIAIILCCSLVLITVIIAVILIIIKKKQNKIENHKPENESHKTSKDSHKVIKSENNFIINKNSN